jgi:hypothetical protein
VHDATHKTSQQYETSQYSHDMVVDSWLLLLLPLALLLLLQLLQHTFT